MKTLKMLFLAAAMLLGLSGVVQAEQVNGTGGNIGFTTKEECETYLATPQGQKHVYVPTIRHPKPIDVVEMNLGDVEGHSRGVCKHSSEAEVEKKLDGAYIPFSPKLPMWVTKNKEGLIVRLAMAGCNNDFGVPPARQLSTPLAVVNAAQPKPVATPTPQAPPASTPTPQVLCANGACNTTSEVMHILINKTILKDGGVMCERVNGEQFLPKGGVCEFDPVTARKPVKNEAPASGQQCTTGPCVKEYHVRNIPGVQNVPAKACSIGWEHQSTGQKGVILIDKFGGKLRLANYFAGQAVPSVVKVTNWIPGDDSQGNGCIADKATVKRGWGAAVQGLSLPDCKPVD